MLGLPPWTLLKPRTPVNRPDRLWFNAVTRVLATLRVRYGDPEGGAYFDRPNKDGNNWALVLPSPEKADAAAAYDTLFDLYSVATDSVKVRGTGGRDTPTYKLFCLRGTWLAVTGGTYEFDTAIDLSAKASGYITIDVTRTDTGGTATLEHHEGADPPDGDEDNEYFPLWYIPMDSGEIVTAGIEDWRNTIGARITGIA